MNHHASSSASGSKLLAAPFVVAPFLAAPFVAGGSLRGGAVRVKEEQLPSTEAPDQAMMVMPASAVAQSPPAAAPAPVPAPDQAMMPATKKQHYYKKAL